MFRLLSLALLGILPLVSCGGFPTPVYERTWTSAAELTAGTSSGLEWFAGLGLHIGYIQSVTSTSGGYVTYNNGPTLVSLPISIRVAVYVDTIQPALTGGYHRIWELSTGSTGQDSIYLGHDDGANLMIGIELSGSAGPILVHKYTGLWATLTNGWHDVVVVIVDPTVSTGMRLFIDGAIMSQVGVGFTVPFNYEAASAFRNNIQRTIALGKSSYSTHDLFNGKFDLFQIYAEELDLTTIDDMYTESQIPQGGAQGDPVISGIQGQSFQFHGIPNEIFNLITTPHLHVNSRFIYLDKSPSGPCQYNHTTCWSHPGTYISAVGIRIPQHTIQINAHHYAKGLRLLLDDQVQTINSTVTYDQHTVETEDDISISFTEYDRVELHSSLFHITLINSDTFMNLQVHLKDASIHLSGSKYHHFTQSRMKDDDNHDSYPDLPIHGLIGQTWRNAVYGASKSPVEGDRDSYLIASGDLFGTECEFNYYPS